MSRPNLHTLADGVHVAACPGGDVVFLALNADRYVCLPAGAARLALAPDGARLACDDAGLIADLRGLRLLDDGGQAPDREPPPPLPGRDLDDGPEGKLRASDVIAAAQILRDALLRYRGRSLADLVALARRPVRVPSHGAGDLIDETLRYRRLARWLPLPRKCLLQSFLLLRHLQRRGLGARWVFAARTWPFEAHCWLQSEDLALDDRSERLVAYAPILVV